ncbi:hypothetical protein M885DRAFT_487213 [Pelagophyceae sp. CCMP2097]|nr:hypothetical protein M885DRAFT_487213 [Pelagophyceae sp. CCMP2097]
MSSVEASPPLTSAKPLPPLTSVSAEAVLQAARVVDFVSSLSIEEYEADATYRTLRQAIGRLVQREQGRTSDKQEVQKASRAKKQDRNRAKQQAAAAARALADRTALRAGRIDRLKALTDANGEALDDDDAARLHDLMICDGPVEAPEAVKLLCDGAADADGAADSEAEAAAAATAARVSCYGCRLRFSAASNLHAFYGAAFCPECAALNWRKRHATCDLTGRVALVTGGRVKIGHCVALKLLRGGATVVVTSRFPTDTLRRFEAAADFNDFRERLRLVGCDFRDLRAVEALSAFVEAAFCRLDILVNNACQTIRRPAVHFQHLEVQEQTFLDEVYRKQAPLLTGAAAPAEDVSQEEGPLSMHASFHGALAAADGAPRRVRVDFDESPEDAEQLRRFQFCSDASGQQLDARSSNSWTMKLADVPLAEAAEVFAINALAPLSLCAKLKRALAVGGGPSFIINVSAMEGKFTRLKTVNHPHTNMAKAALNMMTRTSAADYARSNIFMNAVDTGWVNDERPLHEAHRVAQEQHFQTPIDEWDAAARIVDPIFAALNGEHEPKHGEFLKDYTPTEW